MVTLPRDDRSATVLELRSGAGDRAQERALSAVHRLLFEARSAIDGCLAGDVDLVFNAHRAVNRATGLVLDNRLSTLDCQGGRPPWRGSTCPQCGAQVSQGRCWGCGAPPERAS